MFPFNPCFSVNPLLTPTANIHQAPSRWITNPSKPASAFWSWPGSIANSQKRKEKKKKLWVLFPEGQSIQTKFHFNFCQMDKWFHQRWSLHYGYTVGILTERQLPRFNGSHPTWRHDYIWCVISTTFWVITRVCQSSPAVAAVTMSPALLCPCHPAVKRPLKPSGSDFHQDQLSPSWPSPILFCNCWKEAARLFLPR